MQTCLVYVPLVSVKNCTKTVLVMQKRSMYIHLEILMATQFVNTNVFTREKHQEVLQIDPKGTFEVNARKK